MRIKKELVALSLGILIGFLISPIIKIGDMKPEQKTENVITCKVTNVSVNPTDGLTDYDCVMPDGSVQIFCDDRNEIGNPSQITFSYTNKNDYSTYEIVSVK